MNHTPAPWTIEATGNNYRNYRAPCDHDFVVFASDRTTIGIVWSGWSEGAANAEFIVRACNCHAALLEACRMCLEIAEAKRPGTWDDVMAACRAAIAKTTEAAKPT